ncbi:MAG: histidinol-phosphate transaminase [Candidatus Hydrothermales bacterium]
MKEEISNLIKQNLIDLEPYQPGKPIEEVQREYGLKEVSKLASNENLYGVSPSAIKAMRKYLKEMNLYPDDSCYYLRKKIAEKHMVKEDEIIVGNGSVELLYYLGMAFLDENVSVMFNRGSFPMYKIVSKIFNAKIVEIPLNEKNLSCDPVKIADNLNSDTRMIFLANPNNPTGTSFSHQDLVYLLKKAKKDTLIVLDEAYTHFVESEDFPDAFELYKEFENLIIIRTFSKAYGLAGLRIGYLIARPKIINALYKVKIPFNVNRLAQYAALYALDDDTFVKTMRERILREKKFLYKNFDKMNIFYLKSDANFIFVRFEKDADMIYRELLKRGVITRPLPKSLFPNSLRITVGRRVDNIKLVKSLNEILRS